MPEELCSVCLSSIWISFSSYLSVYFLLESTYSLSGCLWICINHSTHEHTPCKSILYLPYIKIKDRRKKGMNVSMLNLPKSIALSMFRWTTFYLWVAKWHKYKRKLLFSSETPRADIGGKSAELSSLFFFLILILWNYPLCSTCLAYKLA